MGKHALLSASSSSRWIHCPPSARLGEKYESKTSSFAEQGTDAHALCEYKVNKLLGKRVRNPTKKLRFYDDEMEECAESYATFVMEELNIAKEHSADPIVIVEQRLDFSRFVPEGFGTGDCLIIADDVLSVIDYKHGLGVLVDAYENPQMMCYALGALELFDGIYDINEVKMTIFQPRRENVSTYVLSKEKLYEWANNTLTPRAQLAFKGEGEFACGKWCQWCPLKNTCRKRTEYNLQLAQYEFRLPDELSDTEIEVVLSKVDDLISWAKDIKDYALVQALDGKEWSDFKLVEGRSVRKYANDEEVIQAVLDAGLDPYEKKLIGITGMTKALGKKKFEELLGGMIIKPQGKPTLVPISDKRQVNTINNVKNEFTKITEENNNGK